MGRFSPPLVYSLISVSLNPSNYRITDFTSLPWAWGLEGGGWGGGGGGWGCGV